MKKEEAVEIYTTVQQSLQSIDEKLRYIVQTVTNNPKTVLPSKDAWMAVVADLHSGARHLFSAQQELDTIIRQLPG